MKIIQYCQHILGIGHLFRSLQIAKALCNHEVILVTGGPHVDANFPEHVREFCLPDLQMDHEFRGLFSTDPHATLEHVRKERLRRLLVLFEKEAPDLFIVELYPFGRKAFRFELDPVLEAIREHRLPSCGVVCSLRDILVEKEDQERHESRAVRTLNRYFDAVLVHADPGFVKIEETFFHLDEVTIPLVYTGYIAPKIEADSRAKIRKRLGISEDEILIVASAGGGSVGTPLLESAINAFKQLNVERSKYLRVYTGPFIGKENFNLLKSKAVSEIMIEEFASDFLSYLAAADLSISMAGYNTSMSILSTKVPALVWPFSNNHEQGLRAERFAEIGALRVLEDQDLLPERLAEIMAQTLSRPSRVTTNIELDGADNTARWIEAWEKGNGKR
ncbi:MAG: glycosyl transferase [Desulfobacterales bacterium]|nr:MAG: glycosyl transferase [Desulfobacterales bacterium]